MNEKYRRSFFETVNRGVRTHQPGIYRTESVFVSNLEVTVIGYSTAEEHTK